MPEPLVLSTREADVVTLTLNDPDRRNAMTQAMGDSFASEVAALARDDSLRAVVLTGAGSAFSAGGDLGMIEDRASEGAAQPGTARGRIRDSMRGFYELFLSVCHLPCPSVAAINGHAVGAGLCVALACDVRVASKAAKLGLNFAKLGLHPGMGASWTLPRLVGPARAAELLYTGRLISGEEAARIGMVNRAVAAVDVLPAALEIAGEIASSGPLAVRALKRALARSPEASLQDQLAFEAEAQAACFESEDVREGLTAAREKRTPRFRGR